MFFFYFLCLFAVALSVAAQHPTRPRSPGVAFRLTPDYGVASLYLSNGTYVPVARIQGTPEYQTFMRQLASSVEKGDTALCKILTPAVDMFSPLFGLAPTFCRATDSKATIGLLHTMKTAVETYLGTNICFAALSLDVREDFKVSVAREALEAIGLRPVMHTYKGAGLTVHAQMPYPHPESHKRPVMVLAIDYSAHWSNVELYTIDEDVLGSVQNFTSSPDIDQENQLEAIEHKLRHFFANPPQGIHLPAQIDDLVIHGDDARNESLRDMLTRTLDTTDLIQKARIDGFIFSSTNVLAREAHNYMDTALFEFGNKGAWGCQWRSGSYPGGQNEL